MKIYQKLRNQKLRKTYVNCWRRITNIATWSYLRKNKDLRDLITEVKKQSGSLGLSDFEYVKLYKMVRQVKPEYALECGTGKSTFIIARAMSKNGNGKKLVTMEESIEWALQQRKALSHFFSHKRVNE